MKSKLAAYKKRRDFSKTKEPKPSKQKTGKKALFVVQKHDASHLHYDFRIEMQGVLKSWAVPKGPPKKIGEKHLAIETEDHPLDYAYFEGVIPEGEYGAGTVEIWDRGTFVNLKRDKQGNELPLESSYKKGTIEIELKGKKLKGGYALVRFRDKNWLLLKMKKKI